MSKELIKTSNTLHHELINCFIGFCYDMPGWPNFLHKEGYKIYWIEQDFTNKNGGKVKPEVIAKSNMHSSALLLECKSGCASEKQFNSYQEIEVSDVTQKAGVSLVKTFDVVFMTYDSNGKEIVSLIDANNAPFILLCKSEKQIEKVKGKFTVTAVDDSTNSPISLSNSYPPISILPLWAHEDYQECEADIEIVNSFVSLLLSDRPETLAIDDFISKYLDERNILSCFPNRERATIRSRIQKDCKRIIKSHFSKYISIRQKNFSDISPHIYDVKERPNRVDLVNRERRAILRIAANAIGTDIIEDKQPSFGDDVQNESDINLR